MRGFSRPICGDATIVAPLHRDGIGMNGMKRLLLMIIISPTLPQVAVMDVDGCWDDWGEVVMDAPSSVWNT